MSQSPDSISQLIQETAAKYEELISRDKQFFRKSTVESLLNGLESLKQLMQEVLNLPQESQEKGYWVLLNGTSQISTWCRLLRQNQYPREATKYIAWCMMTMESNIVLTSVKYLLWRTSLYRELSELYEESGNFKSASKVTTHALKQIQQLREIEECEQPVPEHTKDSLARATDCIKALDMKYGLLTGTLSADAWKKRLEEFPSKSAKLRAALTTLSLLAPEATSALCHGGHKVAWKPLLTTFIIEQVNPDIQVVCRALEELVEKRKRDPEDLELDSQMTKEPVWKAASAACPLEPHLELLKHAYDCKLWDHFYNLAQ